MDKDERWEDDYVQRPTVTAYDRRRDGTWQPFGFGFGDEAQPVISALHHHGNAIIYRDGWPGGMRGEHFSLSIPRSRDHLDVFFCEVGWSGAADAENGDYAWWKLPVRQTASEKYFGVKAGTFS